MLSLSNRKLAKDKIACFGLPAGHSCPGAGACKSFCYGCKGNYRFSNVERAGFANLMATFQRGQFIKEMNAEIRAVKHKITAVRIHDRGDFYDQNYLNAWVKIIRANPDVLFYCYTASLHLDWSGFDGCTNTLRTQSMASVYKYLTDFNVSRCFVSEIGSDSDVSDVNSIRKMASGLNIYLKRR